MIPTPPECGSPCAEYEALAHDNARLRSELSQAQTELESHAWEIGPAMAQAKIDQLNAEVARLRAINPPADEYPSRLELVKAENAKLRQRAETAEAALEVMRLDADGEVVHFHASSSISTYHDGQRSDVWRTVLSSSK
jgi:multidrug resistance efflux pump